MDKVDNYIKPTTACGSLSVSGEQKDLIHVDVVPGEVIVGFKKGITAPEQKSIIEKHNGEILERELALNAVLVHVNDVQACISEITKEKAVEYAEPNYIRKALISLVWSLSPPLTPGYTTQPKYTPNDPHWDEQYNLRLINIDDAWNCEKGDKSIKVAIIDTGIQNDHPDLKGNYVSGGYDWVNDDPYPYDDLGHGTHCAGIAAAVINNKKGIAGIAQVSLMAEKILDENGEGTEWDFARGIRHAADGEANIMCLSLGGYSTTFLGKNACQYAWDAGCLLVAASGDNGTQPVRYPARYETVISVGAIDKNKRRWSDSNYGLELELVAPGVEVISTYPTDSYGLGDGTSFAAPHVAGVAALLWSRGPSLTNQQIRDMLKENTIDLGIMGWDEYYGYGMVNANVVCNAIYVPDDYKNIQDAVNATSSGNTIIVRDGVYTENIDVKKRLIIRSENGPANCIVQAVNPDDHVFEVTADYVDISGFTVKGTTGGGTLLSERWPLSLTADYRGYYIEVKDKAAGIHLKADYCNISNNKCSHNRFGISLDDSNNNSISNNKCGYHGILLLSSSNNMLLNNTVSSNSGVGIFLLQSSNNNEIRKNTALDDLYFTPVKIALFISRPIVYNYL